MLELKLRVQEFCADVIEQKIADGGFAFIDPDTGAILFYAGPSETLIKNLEKIEGPLSEGKYPPNWKVAKEEADRIGAKRIDNTVIFFYLMSNGFSDRLRAECSLVYEEDVKAATKQVWDYVSGCFARTDFHKAATLVCGASKDSSFYREEMLGMLEGDHLKVLNDRPADLFRAFRPLGKDELHRLMAITYLLNMRNHARASNDNKAWANFRKQRKFFVLSRKEDKQEFAKQPKEVRLSFRQARGELLSRFKQRGAESYALPPTPSSPVTKAPASWTLA